MSAYTLVSLPESRRRRPPWATWLLPPPSTTSSEPRPTAPLQAHPAWDAGSGWKHHLTNRWRLLPPYVCTRLLLP